MKKLLYVLAVLAIVLTGCTKENEPTPKEPDLEEHPDVTEEPDEPQRPIVFKADPSNFHFIADWLNDTQILYVEKLDGSYKVNYFDIETGESGLVYEDSSFIIDILVHPNRNYLLVHTSDQSNSAVIKVIKVADGTVHHQVEIDSTELAVEWNRVDPEKILFTAFHEDWSFDLFVYNGHDDSLSIIELDDPFPKWGGENTIMSMMFEDHALDGGDVQLLQIDTGDKGQIGIGNVIYFDVFEDLFVVVQPVDANEFSYTVRRHDGTILSSWTMPAVSNYSEWIVPTIEWFDRDRLLVKGAEKSGQLDEMAAGFTLYLFKNESLELLVKELDAGPMKCSPSGRHCLSGYTSDELIDTERKEKHNWIEYAN